MVRTLRIYMFSVALMVSVMAGAAGSGITDTSTRIDNPAFHTLQTKVNGSEQLPPVIRLGSDDRLDISFDELSDDRRYMRYELIHCDMRWRPDGLVSPEYLDGFNEATVDDYEFSQATAAHYVHYDIHIPNERMNPRLSGNYLLRIYDESDPESTLLQVRFSIVEPGAGVTASASSRTDIDYNESHQQLTIAVDTEGADINNLFTDIAVVVSQNGRIDNVATVSTPSRIAGKTVVYEHNPALIFPAGNEYRRMEITSTTYPGMRVESLGYADPFYHATLYTDEPRSQLPYTYDSTQHGRFRIRQYDADNSDTEADYVVTHFSLDMPEQHGIDIFIDGDLTQRRFSPESRMVFNRATGLYEHSMLLKQGAYNYQYLAVPAGKMTGSASLVEGDRYQTVNEYLIMVYNRRPGERYDRLIGITSTLSGI